MSSTPNDYPRTVPTGGMPLVGDVVNHDVTDAPASAVDGHTHGKGHHLMHLLMCAPMFLIVGAALWSGRANLTVGGVGAALIPAIGCMVMMWAMMSLMNHGPDRR